MIHTIKCSSHYAHVITSKEYCSLIHTKQSTVHTQSPKIHTIDWHHQCVLEECLEHRSRRSSTRSKEDSAQCVGCYASHITVVLSKAAHSGPSVCLRARAPCPLRVSRPGVLGSRNVQQACCTLSVQRKLQSPCASASGSRQVRAG